MANKFLRRRISGQSTMEFALLVACVISALVTMQFYMKRSFQGRLKQYSDEIGEHYDSEKSDIKVTTNLQSNLNVTSKLINLGTDPNGDPIFGVESTVTQNQTLKRTGHEKVGADEQIIEPVP